MPWIYQPYTSLSALEQQAIVRSYQQKFLDFDNDIIIYSALEVLRENGHTDINAIHVGQDTPGEDFELFMQLINKIPQDKRYTIFSLPTRQGRHSVAVVIDTQNHECHVVDSINQYYGEAVSQIQTAIDYGVLEGYRIVRPTSQIIQQDDQWSCGIHSSANIVGIITGDIDLKTNKGLNRRSSAEVQTLLGIFSKAYEQISIQRGQNLDNPRLNVRQKRTLRYGLQGLDTTMFSPQIQNDINQLIVALREELPSGMLEAEVLQQRSLNAFLNEFRDRNPENALNELVNTAEFAQTLPASLEENAELKEAVVTAYLSEQLNALQQSLQQSAGAASSSTPVVAEDLTLETTITHSVNPVSAPEQLESAGAASSSTPVVAEDFTLETAITRFVNPISDSEQRENVRHAIKYLEYMTQQNPRVFNEASCHALASHAQPTLLACALLMLNSVNEDDPNIQAISALDNPMDFWHTQSIVHETEQTAEPAHYPVSSSSSNEPTAEPSSSSPADEELTLELKQFLSTLRNERNGLCVTEFWSSRTKEEREELRTRFNAENQSPAASRPVSRAPSGGLLDYVGSFFGLTSSSSSRAKESAITQRLDEKAQLMGFENSKALRVALGPRVLQEMKQELEREYNQMSPR
ncbi:hypothetical protein ELY21_06045 [Legionella sp. km535]|uniref:hypothetical protein n=1 Tax=Legionella sp. km535 TaxID=2498107 RepID=UPI000F8EDBC2|nr:hypothetical protein [Legionella sp. km535]RUR19083.1 hypothetical protein ELY21_06045 [Legionella sp. km535]